MKCLYCGGQVVYDEGHYVCLDCGRVFSYEQLRANDKDNSSNIRGQKVITPSGLNDSGVEELIAKEEAAGSLSEPSKKVEEVAREEVREKLENIKIGETTVKKESNIAHEKLGFDLSAYKNVGIKNKEIAEDLVHDLEHQAVRNVNVFSKMFRFYGKQVVDNFKKNIKKDE
ncbi:TPA: hypothetical protein DDW69_03850 [candidate division CPR2 bacterium]|uniref:Viral late gene transcription factor 3 zinc ribbon domain-containing protein n=1 Tax=candidate division CPR2 bacterium GW2011_GWC1_41_48 TaxID=1618344 RepID=A0A0G0YHD9_UNCC2|nr:MAG: hypothetical protein UT47_C0003G0042 [candidate division CPR2 bacterium GW2011_GWC2_39_35]KKR28452.1 MAG: hypothetical protein UT59_C0027G0007 [candidate division CPR2 bacterium GW2011_GWD1_39_7]KKR29326.1 MAG: hypothetical protein UT60_C0003G0003 [candidate division CPR2 bacterium GW2011_GWD2_39_7]KKS08981.1 MAG: hypothetical protein UU65_C0003G0036 [candidate division CPR2 bacterium GW2011_GWC1_41_48]OGB60949.1 MAG: hypothetical protein A2Y27_03520 [candidate division CPR2 bacterium G